MISRSSNDDSNYSTFVYLPYRKKRFLFVKIYNMIKLPYLAWKTVSYTEKRVYGDWHNETYIIPLFFKGRQRGLWSRSLVLRERRRVHFDMSENTVRDVSLPKYTTLVTSNLIKFYHPFVLSFITHSLHNDKLQWFALLNK